MKNAITILFLSSLILSGCAGVRDALKNPFALDGPLTGHYMAKAAAFEKQGELGIALQYWEVINGVTPDKEVSTKKIKELKHTISQRSEMHYKKGVILLKQKKTDIARKELLSALRLNPNHTSALELLTLKIENDDTISYTINSGDTFKGIAKKVYNNPDAAFLIRSSSPKTREGLPLPGKTVMLPYLEKQYHQQKKPEKEATCLIERKIEEDLALAGKYFKAGNYDKVLSITECILENDSENSEAYNLTLDSYYQLGKKFRKSNEYFSSLAMFQKLDPEYKDVGKLLLELDKTMKEQSEIHYRQGLKHFINEDLNKAIAEWEKALALNPANKKVEKDIKDARGLLEKLKKIE